jgi:hypothetical protein
MIGTAGKQHQSDHYAGDPQHCHDIPLTKVEPPAQLIRK